MQKTSYQQTGIWLGLFAMLMIHLGPLISSVQLYSQHQFQSFEAFVAAVEHAKHEMAESADHHAVMGHHTAAYGVPDWVNQLAMCGYCDLLTVNPPLTVAVFNHIPFIPSSPRVEWVSELPYVAPALWTTAYPRAPPVNFIS
ncbi:DUF2946 domain-containing protein [Pseudomonas sp. F1_0610]|uniref:DUF2946 domain-containing protein n=1 Tax=Pseudomonas sp. F1_0610 TaxID=3114284 RepID=UPI0039C255C7